MDDQTFYCLSYLAFCLAMLFPFGWIIYRASRQPARPDKKPDNPNKSR